MAQKRIIDAIQDAYGFASPDSTMEEARAAFTKSMTRSGLPAGTTSAEATVGGVRGLWITPDSEAQSVMVYFHGGGYLTGSARSHSVLAAHLARDSLARVFVPDYRLAPENPFPAAYEDARAVIADLLQDEPDLVVAGDSAGAGLALAALLALKSDGVAMPAAVITFSAWTDLTLTSDTFDTFTLADPLVSRDQLEMNASAYLGDHDRWDPAVSPLYGDLAGLPRLYMQVGSEEVLSADTLRFADRVRDAAGDVVVALQEGMPHVHQALLWSLPEAGQSVAKAGSFVKSLKTQGGQIVHGDANG